MPMHHGVPPPCVTVQRGGDICNRLFYGPVFVINFDYINLRGHAWKLPAITFVGEPNDNVVSPQR